MDAQNTIGNFYKYLNLFQYEKARSYLTAEYARKEKNYSIESLKSWESKKDGKTKIDNIKRENGQSQETTKVFRYETRYDKKNGGKNCGDKLIAYVVLRNGIWTIDSIEYDVSIPCSR